MYGTMRHLALSLTAGVLIIATQATATTIQTTSYTSWESYLINGANTEIPPPASHNSYNNSTGVTLTNGGQSFVFTGPDGSSWVLSSTQYGGFYGLEGGSGGSIKVTTPAAGDNAIFITVAAINGSSLTLTLSDGEFFTVANGNLGLALSHPITWFTLSAPSGVEPFIDDFYFGSSNLAQDTSPSSEAATFGLMGGGLIVLFGARRKWFARRKS